MAWNWNEIQSVLKEETFKTWRERTNELIEQQNNFVSWQAAIDSRWYVTDTSSSTTTYTGVTSPGATGTDSLVAGYFIIFKPATNNTGASTLNVASSDGAVDIKKITSGAKVALVADDLDSDTYAELIFDGTDWVLLNPPALAGDFKLDDLGPPDDNTDLDFSTSTHGLVPKGTNTGNFLKDDGTWETVDAFPAQSGNAGKFLTTDASTASWATVDALPAQSGNAGKFLTTDASTASWATLDTDANKTTKGLYEHEHTIGADYSIASGSNALSAGPITIDTGNSVTVPTGSTWVIV